MEASNADTFLKPALSSTKSIDEGFESDPDREQSNTESDSSLLATITQQPSSTATATPTITATASSSIATTNQAKHQQHATFDILQRTDRDGMQHTQITRRPLPQIDYTATNSSGNNVKSSLDTGTMSASANLRQRKKDLDKNRIVYSNSKVSIPRAGAVTINNGNQRIQIISSGASMPTSTQQQLSIVSSSNHDHRRLAGKAIELNGSRLAKSGELLLRSTSGNGGRSNASECINFTNAIDKHSQVALINGKLICVNMPVTQIIPSTATILNAPHNHHSKRHFLNSNHGNNTNNISNQTTKIIQYPSHHNQKYISSGRSNGEQPMNGGPSVAHLVNSAIIQNANSSMHTFYPAEGNISLIPSQYGLKYKSTHGGLHEQQAPITMWSQSLARQPRR